MHTHINLHVHIHTDIHVHRYTHTHTSPAPLAMNLREAQTNSDRARGIVGRISPQPSPILNSSGDDTEDLRRMRRRSVHRQGRQAACQQLSLATRPHTNTQTHTQDGVRRAHTTTRRTRRSHCVRGARDN